MVGVSINFQPDKVAVSPKTGSWYKMCEKVISFVNSAAS